MIRYVPQLGGNQKTRYTTQADKPKKKEKREVKQNEPRIVMSGEETEGQQNAHQKRDGNDELRENCKKMPATLEAVQTHLKVKKSPRHSGSDYHERVRLKTRCEIERVSRASVSQRHGKARGPEHPEQIGGQYPISKVSDFHFVQEGDSALFVGVSNLRRILTRLCVRLSLRKKPSSCDAICGHRQSGKSNEPSRDASPR